MLCIKANSLQPKTVMRFGTIYASSLGFCIGVTVVTALAIAVMLVGISSVAPNILDPHYFHPKTPGYRLIIWGIAGLSMMAGVVSQIQFVRRATGISKESEV